MTFRKIIQPLQCETGQALTEYAMILAFVAIVAIAALTLIGDSTRSFLQEIATRI